MDRPIQRYDCYGHGAHMAHCDYGSWVSYLAHKEAIDTLRAELEALRAKTACAMGVGAGDGQLFVHGDYDSIKAAQALVFRAERAEAALNLLERVLGPTVPTSVTSSGARCEWEEALKILAKAKAERA